MKAVYELKRFKTSNSKDLVKALKLYSDNIDPAYRTDSKQIIYWIDNFNKQANDNFFVLGLYLNDRLIGFSELGYFFEEKLAVVDYLVIEKPFRGINTFYQFVHHIREFLESENLIIDYVLGEIGCFFENEEPPESSKMLVRLLKMSRFGVVKCKYYVPRLGLTNYESEMVGVLMIYADTEIKQIKTETLLSIISAIYFKYYQRWYDEFLNEPEKAQYQTILKNLFDKIVSQIGKKQVIEINGYHNLWKINLDYKTGLKYNKNLKIMAFVLIFLACIIVVGATAFLIRKRFGVDINSQSTIVTSSFLLVLIIFSAFFEKRSNFFSGLLEKLIDKF